MIKFTSPIECINTSIAILCLNFQLIKDCKTRGKTVIFSSHIMTEVDLLCDDLAIIHKGNLLYNSTMDAFREEIQGNTLTEAFIKLVRGEALAA